MDYKIFWTQQAISNLEEVLDYLVANWTEKEVSGFKRKLSKQIDLIQRFFSNVPGFIFQFKIAKSSFR